MRVRMLANVGLWNKGSEVDLPEKQAKSYIKAEVAEALESDKKPETVEAKDEPHKPASGRATKAVKPPENKG